MSKKHQQRIKQLLAALDEAVLTIKYLHGPEAWEFYWNNAPEMKRIRAAMAGEPNADPSS